MQPKLRTFLAAGIPLLLADRASKSLAFDNLQPLGVPYQLIGNVVRLTLLLNRDAAMNLTLGAWSRWGFATIAVVGVIVVTRLLWLSPPGAKLRGVALGLIAAGAIGNLIDRLRWDRGVVDFIDVGIGSHRFWTFNVADAGVMIGAFFLAFVFSREQQKTPSQPGVDSAAPG
jgi:signal peptidase II